MTSYEPVIPKADLVHGEYYWGRCRNASIARWNGDEQQFYYWRTKFGHKYIETIKAPEDEQRYDVFIAEHIVDFGTAEIPFEVIPLKEKEL